MRIYLVWGWIILPGCWALVTLSKASGHLDGKLSVKCWYQKGYENYNKYWCRKTFRSPCLMVIETKGSETIVKRNRVSIEDIHTFSVFVVTVEDLRQEDAGTYWCGIERFGPDLMGLVEVNVLPVTGAPTTLAPTEELTTAATFASSFTWTVHDMATTNTLSNGSDTASSTPDPLIYILTPCLLLVLVLVSLTAFVFIQSSRKRRKVRKPAEKINKNINLHEMVHGDKPSSPAKIPEELGVHLNRHQTSREADDYYTYDNYQYMTQDTEPAELYSDCFSYRYTSIPELK